jgi:carbonic anhydrase/acetyltransferase-like protein (isoleucine patch superfamily)
MFIEYKGKSPRVHPSAFVAPTAVLIGDVEIGEESSVWFGAVIRADNGAIRIGARSNLQDNAVIHVGENSQTIVGDDVTIGHCAFLEDCVVENGALIGTNSVVLNGATVGRRSLIGAGSVVTANATIPPESVAVGAPAVVKKKLEGVAVAWVDHAGPEYVHLSRSYLHHGIGDPEVHELVEAKPN